VYKGILSKAAEYLAANDVVYHMRSNSRLKLKGDLEGAVEIYRSKLEDQAQAVLDDMAEKGIDDVVLSGFRRNICVAQVAEYSTSHNPSVPVKIAEELCL